MKLFDVVYCKFYRLYNRKLEGGDPHSYSTRTLSFFQGIIMVFALQFVSVAGFCFYFGVLEWLAFFIAVDALNEFHFYRSERASRIISEDVQIINNNVSVAIAVVFPVFSTSLFYWGTTVLEVLGGGCDSTHF